jgi:hypothetical protein
MLILMVAVAVPDRPPLLALPASQQVSFKSFFVFLILPLARALLEFINRTLL